MARTNKQDLESAYEIAALEKTRASELVKRLEDSHLIEDFREQFIVRGFLCHCILSVRGLSRHDLVPSESTYFRTPCTGNRCH
jgi:hypothetical protein